jgi:hypothetical protein
MGLAAAGTGTALLCLPFYVRGGGRKRVAMAVLALAAINAFILIATWGSFETARHDNFVF